MGDGTGNGVRGQCGAMHPPTPSKRRIDETAQPRVAVRRARQVPHLAGNESVLTSNVQMRLNHRQTIGGSLNGFAPRPVARPLGIVSLLTARPAPALVAYHSGSTHISPLAPSRNASGPRAAPQGRTLSERPAAHQSTELPM